MFMLPSLPKKPHASSSSNQYIDKCRIHFFRNQVPTVCQISFTFFDFESAGYFDKITPQPKTQV